MVGGDRVQGGVGRAGGKNVDGGGCDGEGSEVPGEGDVVLDFVVLGAGDGVRGDH